MQTSMILHNHTPKCIKIEATNELPVKDLPHILSASAFHKCTKIQQIL